MLSSRRPAAAAYVRELLVVFPEASGHLEAAAQAYDRESEVLKPLHELLHSAHHREAITAEERAEAQRLIDEALAADRDAIAQIEAALAILSS